MTKAKRIFNDTYTDCRKFVRDWGNVDIDENGNAIGYNRMTYRDDETVCTRTMNEIKKFYEKERKFINLVIETGVYDTEMAKQMTDALDMVESTIENQIRNLNH